MSQPTESQVHFQPAEKDFDDPSPIQESQLHIQPSAQDFDDIVDTHPHALPLPEYSVENIREPVIPWYQQLWVWLLITGAVALFGGLLFELVNKYLDAYQTSPVISVTLLGINGVFIGLLAILLGRELLAYRRVSVLVSNPQQTRQTLQEGNREAVIDLLRQRDHHTSLLAKQYHQRFWASLQPYHTGQECLHIYRSLVADPLREKAESLIQPAMLQGAGLSLISPSNTIHTMILLWRSAKIVRDIAYIYGLRPGFFGTFTLLRIALENALLQQGAELLIDAGVSKISQGLLSLVAEKSAEASVTGLLIRRIAKATIQEFDLPQEEQTDKPTKATPEASSQ